ncbi:hypothetical protein [Methanolobus profundi]|uniref:Uncharacterized protein n=1 Tax=Methanolobus profundi TaxID=487685 RepID=A0A1I4P3H2_9EURY|nr:hypothetical protein [Methanolobus profundi]SFM22205.1 hypothetical protein SAMN04488696_0428 [Methanolobus profundi]
MNKKIAVFIMLLVLSLAVSGCSDKETTTTTVEGEDGKEYEVTYTEGVEDEVCPVGSTMTIRDPNTGESMVMEVLGTEVIEGIEMCHTVAEMNVDSEDGFARMEMYTPIDENEESFIMTYYDEDGNVMSEMKAINGKITMTDEEGNVVMEMDTSEQE